MRFIFGFLFACALRLSAWADADCSTRDFRPQLGPIRDQKDLSWCYAMSSADLVTQKTGKRVSAVDLATTFMLQSPDALLATGGPAVQEYLQTHPQFYAQLAEQRKEDENTRNFNPDVITGEKGLYDTGGSASSAVFLANAKGICLEKDLPTNGSTVLEYLKESQAVHNKLAMRKRAPICVQTDTTSSVVDAVSIAITRNYEQLVENSCKRERLEQDLIPVETGESGIGAYLDKYQNDPVGRKRLHDQLFSELNRALDAGKAAEIGYSLYSVVPKAKDQSDRDADHSSVIAGRKMIHGVCHYLLRNTQGPSCDYLPQLKSRCSQGHVWLTREELEPTLYEVTYLK